MIVVWHVGSARLAFRRGNGIEGSMSAVECAAPVPEEFAGASAPRVLRRLRVAAPRRTPTPPAISASPPLSVVAFAALATVESVKRYSSLGIASV